MLSATKAAWITAYNAAKDGDTIKVAPGTYKDMTFKIAKDGLTIDMTGVKINATGQENGIMIYDADRTTLFGPEVYEAEGTAVTSIFSDRLHVHHLYAHDNYKHGFFGQKQDRTVLQYSTFANNGDAPATSNISLKHYIAMDNKPEYHNIIKDINSYGAGPAGYTTDGAGIIIDDFNFTQSDKNPAYEEDTLIYRSTCHDNRVGVYIAWSDHVTVQDVDLWDNERNLIVHQSDDVTLVRVNELDW
jgi:hypothetical protein